MASEHRTSGKDGIRTASLNDRSSPIAQDHNGIGGNIGGKLEDDEFTEDNGDEVDDDIDADDEDDNLDDPLWNDLKSSWKQHLVAIMVALAAALSGYFRLSTAQGLSSLIGIPKSTMVRHIHVQDYQRLSNVTFCGAHDLSETTLEFRVPREMLPVIERYYQADMDQDDHYGNDVSTIQVQHAHLDCAREQTSSFFIKGYTSAYMSPSIQQIMRDPNSQAASLSFTGFAAKFINLSDKPKLLFWAGRGGHTKAHKLISEVAPMEAVGTATTPGQTFFITPVFDSSHHLQSWTVTADAAILVYEDENMNLEKLSQPLLLKYQMQKLNWSFAADYLAKTGRTWLSYFPRPPPIHMLWAADYLGQRHEITSSTGHFTHKSTQSAKDVHLQIRVSSAVPRVFEIDNFLSIYECQELMKMAEKKGLYPSTVDGASRFDKKTRSSKTTWLSRHSSDLVDAIYLRAADVLQIHETLFRHASPHHDSIASHHSISEDIQIVRYTKGQEYTPHHDFIYPSITNRHQPSRFATLLVYLHAPLDGGETTFPRSVTSSFHEGLTVKPVVGKAILFYNMLSDGNIDDLSQHGSNAVGKGEKWVANIWIWDPIVD